jgi:DNA (cytosine-5)-methyltransferase 1
VNVLDLFSGIGGFSLGLERAGMRTVAFCEIDPWCQAVLSENWPNIPIHKDITTLRGADVGPVDLICGGFPCQDVSISNVTGAGLDGARSGLWFEYARIIGEIRPRFVIVENVAELLNRGMGRVLGALADLGYDAEWRVLRGLDVGLPFIRERVWIVAEPQREGRQRRFQYLSSLGIETTPSAERRHQAIRARDQLETHLHGLRADDGLSVTMERRRIHGLGNAVVPQIPEIIGRAIMMHEISMRDYAALSSQHHSQGE